jgi:hypothetical protein
MSVAGEGLTEPILYFLSLRREKMQIESILPSCILTATAVAFPQKSESIPHQKKSECFCIRTFSVIFALRRVILPALSC